MNVILINYMKIHVGEGCPADPGEEGRLHKRTYYFSLKNLEAHRGQQMRLRRVESFWLRYRGGKRGHRG